MKKIEKSKAIIVGETQSHIAIKVANRFAVMHNPRLKNGELAPSNN